MDFTTSDTVDEGGDRDGVRDKEYETAERECEAHAHDRLLQLLITTEHHLVHAY
jgi:hypothetical protein